MMHKRLFIGIALMASMYFILSLLPQAYRFENTTLAAKTPVLGKDQLHSPQMAAKHIELSRDADLFAIKDITTSRKTTVYYKTESVNASAVVVNSKTTVLINNIKLILKPENEKLLINVVDNKQHYVFSKTGLYSQTDGVKTALNTCRVSEFIPDFVLSLASAIKDLGKPPSLLLGGPLICNKRLSLAGNTMAKIHLIEGDFVLHSAAPEGVFVKTEKDKEWQSLASKVLPGNGRFWAGRTLYEVDTLQDEKTQSEVYKIKALALKPVQLASQHELKENEQWTPILKQMLSFNAIQNTLLLLVFVLLLAVMVWKFFFYRKTYETQQLQCYIFSVFGFTILLLERLSWLVLPIEWSLYLLLLCMVLLTKRVWHVALGLVAIAGVFNQLTLALAAGTDNMLAKTHEQIVALSCFCLLVLLFKAFRFNILQLLRYKSAQYFIIACFIFGLLLQLAAGSEVGIPGLPNPIETLKVAMAYLAASFMGCFIFFHGSLLSKQFLKIVKAGGGFLIIAGIFLVSMSDFSPSLVLLAMVCAIVAGLSLLFITRENATANKFAYILPAVTLSVLLSFGYYLSNKLDDISIDTYELSGLPAVDRWKTLELPNQNYINSYQVNQAKLAQINAQLMPNTQWHEGFAVPAIQDDFAITHMLARLGKILATLFVFTFAGLASYFLLFSFSAMKKSILSKDLLKVRLEVIQLAIFSLLMSSALLAHIFINISSNLGFMPVMGQPLAFVSIANSHLLFFIMPTVLAIGLLENQIKRI